MKNGTASIEETRQCDGATFSVRVTNAGPAELTVRARREDEILETQQVVLTGINSAPEIKSFVASPNAGPAPFRTTVQWLVSDANLDSVSCELKVEARLLKSFPDCRAATSYPVEVAEVGTAMVTLVISDGSETTTATLSLTTRRPTGDFKIVQADIGQTFFSPGVAIVANREALLRVVATVGTAGLIASGTATISLPNGRTEELQLNAPERVPTKVIEADLSQIFWARVPAELVVPGMTALVKLQRPAVLDDSNPDNENALVIPPPIEPGAPLAVTWVPITFEGLTASVENVDPHLVDLLPVASVQSLTRTPYLFNADFTDPYVGWGDLLSDMWTLRLADAATSTYYASIATTKGGDIAGMAYLGSPVASGLSDLAYDVSPHELGHTFSLDHAPCGVWGDASYPYPAGRVGVEGISLEAPTPILYPRTHKDLMSYCQPTWISDYNYQKIRTFLRARALRSATSAVPVASIRGSISADGDLRLQPLLRLLAPYEPTERGELEVRINGVAHQLQTFRGSEGDRALHFAGVVPDPGVVKTLLVTHGDQQWSRQATRNVDAPVPSLTESDGMLHVRWDVGHYPYAAVRHVSGEQRTTLALKLVGGDAELSLAGLPIGGSFEVSLSDGLNGARTVHVRD